MPHGNGVASVRVAFAGAEFRQYQQVGKFDPVFAGGRWSGKVTIPQRVFDQLAARQKAGRFPGRPRTTGPPGWRPNGSCFSCRSPSPTTAGKRASRIDGRTVELRKAYTAVRAARRTFVGFYADLSLLSPDREHAIELDLPALRPGQLQGVFFENIEPTYTDAIR